MQLALLPQGSISLTLSSLIIERKLVISLIKSKRPCFCFKLVVDVVAEAMGWFGYLIADTALWVRTLIGRSSQKEGTYKAHHGTFEEDDVKRMKRMVKWEDRRPFHVIPLVYRYNLEMKRKKEHGGDLEKKWNSILRYYETKYKDETKDFKVLLDGGLPSGWEASLPKWSTSDPVDATRYDDFKLPASPRGRNIRYGVREHAMAGIANGIALHGSGLKPFATTFLMFSDYKKNSIRLSALSHAGVLYVFTHDSIGLGEDGPTPAGEATGRPSSYSSYVSLPTCRRKRESDVKQQFLINPNVIT
ncbi:unnamed protein product [Musa hybrid cultivar]